MVNINSDLESDVLVIGVSGDVDASSSIHLDNAIEQAFNDNHKKILIDLSTLEYISSAGLGVFISRLEEMNEKNINLVLFGLNDSVKQVFEILGLEKLLKIVNDKTKAIEHLNEA